MLPSLDNTTDKGQVQEIVSEIATAVFKSAKVSMESAAKTVIPSVPKMVEEVLEDLQSGSVRTFNLALDKLDRLVQKLGIDLKDYSKELANFQTKREEKLIKSETKIQALREKNIVATIEKSGDIKILSQAEIRTRQDNLKLLEKNIADMEKSLEKDRKLLQEDKKLKTTAISKKRKDISLQSEAIEEKKKQRDEQKEVLGDKGEKQPGIFQRGREGVSNFVDEYVPDVISDIGGTFIEGFMAPINAVKELGKTFGQILKPLKLLKPLFTGLIGTLKKFALGLKASILAMLPQIALGVAILAVLGLIYVAMKKLQDFFGKDDKTGLEDYGEDIGGPTPVAEEGDMSSKVMRRSIVDQETKKIIQPDDPRYDEIYERDRGVPAPKKGEVFSNGKRKIIPLTKDGFEIKSGNIMNPENRSNYKTPTGLEPVKDEKIQSNNSIVDGSSKVFNNNETVYAGGVSGSKNSDLELFQIAHPLYNN